MSFTLINCLVIGSLEIVFEGDWLFQVVSHNFNLSLYLPDKLICIFFLSLPFPSLVGTPRS